MIAPANVNTKRGDNVEILSQTTHWWEFIFGSVFIGIILLFSVFLSIGGILTVIYDDRSIADVILTLLYAISAIGLSIILFSYILTGPDVTYKAKVTDFNAVYHNGYEIVNHNGKLYTLRKVGE